MVLNGWAEGADGSGLWDMIWDGHERFFSCRKRNDRSKAKAVVMIAFLGLLLVGGCSTLRSKSSAEVPKVLYTVQADSPFTVASAIREEFEQAGYMTRAEIQDVMVFEKEISAVQAAIHGDWGPGRPWLRVKVYVGKTGPLTVSVSYQAFWVEDRGDPAMEEQRPAPGILKKRVEKLLRAAVQHFQ